MLVPEGFNTDPEPNGDILMYPEGDKSAPPSGRMPNEGWYFDSIVRQPPVDDDNLNIEDNLEEFGSISDEELERYNFLEEFGSTTSDVYAADGRYLGVVEMPQRFQPRTFRGDKIYGVWRDELDVQYVMRLRVVTGE